MIYRHFMATAGVALLAACGSAPERAEEAATPAAQTESKGRGEPYVKAHSIKELMANVVEPQAQVYWRSAGAVVDEQGEHDLTPTTDEAWLATRSAAATVTEMGNLLMTPLYAEGRGEDWIQFSKALVQIGMRAEKAAVDRDSAAIFDIGGTLYRVCQACHQVYPPKEGPASGNPQAPAADKSG